MLKILGGGPKQVMTSSWSRHAINYLGTEVSLWFVEGGLEAKISQVGLFVWTTCRVRVSTVYFLQNRGMCIPNICPTCMQDGNQ